MVSTDSSSLERSLSEVFETVGSILTEEMGDRELREDLAKVARVLQEAKDSIGDFDVSDVVKKRVPFVERDLAGIWDKVIGFRWIVRELQGKHK